MKKVTVFTAVLFVTLGGTALAGTLEKGDTELDLRLSYAQVDFERGGESEEARVSLSYGRMLTDTHEVGGEVFYEQEGSFDGTGVGGFYNYNFKAGTNLNPFVGALGFYLTGDLGDVYETAFGVIAGVKVWSFEHAGFAFGGNYFWLQGKGPAADAEQFSLFTSIRVRL